MVKLIHSFVYYRSILEVLTAGQIYKNGTWIKIEYVDLLHTQDVGATITGFQVKKPASASVWDNVTTKLLMVRLLLHSDMKLLMVRLLLHLDMKLLMVRLLLHSGMKTMENVILLSGTFVVKYT